MRKFLLTVLALAALTACERPFELKEGTLQNRLYLDCLAGAGDTTFVTVQTCIPVNTGKAVKTVRTDIESMSLKVGSRQAALTGYTREGMRYNRWYTLEPIPDGETVSVEVKARGMEAAMAETVVPAAPVIEAFSEQVYQKDSSWVRVDLRIAGERSRDDYFGIVCLEYFEYEQLAFDGTGAQIDSIHLDGMQPVSFAESVDEDELFSSSGDNFFDFSFDGASLIDDFTAFGDFSALVDDSPAVGAVRMRMWIPKETFLEKNGGRIRFYANRSYCDTLSYHQESITDPLSGEEVIPKMEVVSRSRFYYKWRIFRLSPDFFHYAQSRWLLNNNFLSFIGLAPATSAWSNVKGGFGVVAGCRYTETPWEKSLKPATLSQP